MQACLKELRTLKQEENTLMNIASKISDQLNRLKVEELALQNLIRVQNDILEVQDNTQVSSDIKQEADDDVKMVPLDLEVRGQHYLQQEQEEEEEDEEEEEEEMEAYSVHEDLEEFVQSLTEQGGS